MLEKLEFHDEGFQEMLKSSEVASVLNDMAQKICDQSQCIMLVVTTLLSGRVMWARLELGLR